MDIRKGPLQAEQRLSEPLKPRPLPGQRHCLHHIRVELVADGIDLARREYSVDKLPNPRFMVFRHHTLPCKPCGSALGIELQADPP
jgi:hypothetical protein